MVSLVSLFNVENTNTDLRFASLSGITKDLVFGAGPPHTNCVLGNHRGGRGKGDKVRLAGFFHVKRH